MLGPVQAGFLAGFLLDPIQVHRLVEDSPLAAEGGIHRRVSRGEVYTLSQDQSEPLYTIPAVDCSSVHQVFQAAL